MGRLGRVLIAFTVAAATLLGGVTPALAAFPQSGSRDQMVHEEPAPIKPIMEKQKVIPTPQITQESRLHGVYNVAASTPEPAKIPDDSRFTTFKPVRALFTRLFDNKTVTPLKAVKASPNDDTSNEIAQLSVQWQDIDPNVDTWDDTPINFPARVTYQLSGTRNHAPDTVHFTIPLAIFRNWQNSNEGGVEMSMPSEPSAGALFTYKRVADRIIVSNTQTLPATYGGHFDFAYTQITPHDLDTSQHPSLTVTAAVSDGDKTFTKTSNTIAASVTTHEEVDSAKKQGDTNTDLGQASISRPDYINFDKDKAYEDSAKYWYVNWYMWAHVRGNRRFTLHVKDTPTNWDETTNRGQDPNYGRIIGTDIPGAKLDNNILTSENAFTGFVEAGNNFYYHVTMAYPRSVLNGLSNTCNGSGPLNWVTEHNQVTFEVVPAGGGTSTAEGIGPSSVSPNAIQKNTKYPYCVNGDVFNVYKHGPKKFEPEDYEPKSGFEERYPAEDPDHPWQNEYGLNRLRAGKDFTATWSVTGVQYTWGDTFGEGNPNDPNNYGKRFVRSVIEDDQQWFDRPNRSAPPLTADEATIDSLTFVRPTVLEYRTDPTSSSGYAYYASTKDAPDATVWAKVSGSYEKVGVVTYANGGVQVTNASNGASASGMMLKLPAEATAWRVSYTSKDAGEDFYVDEKVTIHPKGSIPSKIATLFQNSQNPTAYLDNEVKMGVLINPQSETQMPDLSACSATDTKHTVTGSTNTGNCAISDSRQWVEGAWQRASMSKQGWQIGNNPTIQAAKIRYQMTAKTDTNVSTPSVLDRLVSEQVFARDNSARFYDLLPHGIRPDLSTVKVDGGTVTGTRLEENWRGSGRQMLIISVTGLPSQKTYKKAKNAAPGSPALCSYRTARFDATYSALDSNARGGVERNVAAYVSDTKQLGTVTGYESTPDMPDARMNQDSADQVRGAEEWMSNLESDPSTPRDQRKVSTLYGSTGTTPITQLSYSGTGLDKKVSLEGSDTWSDHNPGITVPEGGAYRYRISEIGASGKSAIGNIVFVDNLEAYHPSGVTTTNWHGTLIDVDTSALSAQGIAPVVWYRTSLFDTSRAPVLSNSNGWTRKPEDISQVKAVAIDCSKKNDGSPYILPVGQALEAELLMRAPVGEEAVQGRPSTYNDDYMYASGQSQPLQHGYTKATLIPSSIKVVKAWDDDNNRDTIRPSSVHVSLTKDGKPTLLGADLTNSDNWTHVFTHLPTTDEKGNAIRWGVEETNLPKGYQGTSAVSGPDADGVTTVHLTNTHKPDTVSISGEKTWQDGTAPLSLTLHLWSDDNSSGTLQDTGRTKRVSPVAGSWSWTWAGLPKNRNVKGTATPVKYAVSEAAPEGWKPVDDKGNQLDASHLYPADQKTGSTGRMVNVWHPFGNLSLTKTATDAAGPAREASFTFTLGLTKSDGSPDHGIYTWKKKGGVCDTTPTDPSCSGQVSNGQAVTLKAGQTLTVEEIPMGDRYLWTEADASGFHAGRVTNMSGIVRANETIAASIENVYRSAGYGYVTAQKTLTGRSIETGQFEFTLSPVTGKVDQNGNGGTVGPVLSEAGNSDSEPGSDGHQAEINFSAIAYTQKDDGKTFWYEMREMPYNHSGYTSDSTVYRVKMVVKDQGNGTLKAIIPTYYKYANGQTTLLGNNGMDAPQFTNAYSAKASLPIVVQKVYVGGNLATRHFTFHLTGNGTDNHVEEDSGPTDDSGVAKFPDLMFRQDATHNDAGKTFQYTVRENIDTTDKTIKWDEHAEIVKVAVVDNGDGTLGLTETYENAQDNKPIVGTPLVWRNVAGGGPLTIEKKLTDDKATQDRAKIDTAFPMRVYLAAPAGGSLPNTVTVTKPTADTYSTSGSVPVHFDSANQSGWVNLNVHGGSSISITGLPGGTSYTVVEQSRREAN